MYIHKTTAAERLTIESAVGDLFDSIDRAHFLLCGLWEENFGSYKQEDISAYKAEEIGATLYMLTNVIFDALLEYALTVGRADFRGVEPYLEGGRRAQAVIDCEKLHERAYKPVPNETRRAIMDVSDEDAIPMLKHLLEKR